MTSFKNSRPIGVLLMVAVAVLIRSFKGNVEWLTIERALSFAFAFTWGGIFSDEFRDWRRRRKRARLGNWC